jgi:hypothetical protein
MTIGELKSKIEKKLFNSYIKKTFSEDIKIFKKLVLENKNINKLFFLYDELSDKKGLENEIADSFINECIVLYENTMNKISNNDLKTLFFWIKNTKSENNYKLVDELFSNNILELEKKAKSKKFISENLSKKIEPTKEVFQIPLKTSINIANKVMLEHIEKLNEEEKKELKNILYHKDDDLLKDFLQLKKEGIKKLNELKESSDNETTSKINETIEKINNESYTKPNYYKLKLLISNL